MPTSSVVQILTASIAPVIVISGVGLLLLSITNRYGRSIDRARALMRELEQSEASSSRHSNLGEQLRHTYRRAHLLRASMIFGAVSVLFVSLMILSLFAEQVFGMHRDFVALPFFALCLVSLLISIYYTIRDITSSLAALELEVEAEISSDSERPPGPRRL
jgi:hypothetical protein